MGRIRAGAKVMDPITISSIFAIGGKLIDKLFPDPEQKAKAHMELLKLQQDGEFKMFDVLSQSDKNQSDVNLEEARSESLFKSGWRPAIGWVCVGGLAYQVVFRPLLTWVAHNAWGWDAPPSLEMDSLMTLLFGMLGLGAYRTYEKTRSPR